MAKFLSHDGKDNNGIRAEVNVMTGTGRIKQITKKEDSRNAEIEFDPDNPNLKRKVAGFLDTTSIELWEYVQAAHKDQRTIEYRIESQRRRKVDRATPFADLTPTDDITRILAAVDGIRSSEAVTNPAEDPTDGRVPAREEDRAINNPVSGASVNPAQVLAALARARKEGLSEIVIDTLIAQALAIGADFDEVVSAGFSNEEESDEAPTVRGRVAAQEEKPWTVFNSDGRLNLGSYMVTHATTAEQFALDHLLGLYSQGKKSNVDVSDQMIAQAASLAFELLNITDEVQTSGTKAKANRQKNSYGRALSLVLDAVGKRYSAPLGEKDKDELTKWHNQVVGEASERLYGVSEVAQGRIPMSMEERASNQPLTPKNTASEVEPAVIVEPEAITPSSRVASAAEALGAKVVPAKVAVETPETIVKESELTPASPEQIARLKAICERAGVMAHSSKISDWLEKTLGVRIARQADAFVLEEWLAKYEVLAAEVIFKEVVPE